jgi:hypothetical protein
LDQIAINVTDFKDISRQVVGEISSSNYSLSMKRSDQQHMLAFSFLRLVECNSHVKKLTIEQNSDDYSIESRMINYLSQHCGDLQELMICSASEETARLMMASFRKLSTFAWITFTGENLDSIPTLGEITSYAHIKSFALYQSDYDVVLNTTFIKVCPNLSSLDLKYVGTRIFHSLKDIMASCRSLTKLSLSLDGNNDFSDEDRTTVPMLLAIAEHGLQLGDFHMNFYQVDIDLRDELTRYAMASIIKRLRKFQIKVRKFLTNADDPDTSLCSLFSSPGVDLRSLDIRTYDENADQITILLRCGNAETLTLNGTSNIFEVMVKISFSCRRLVDISLDYVGPINGEAMRVLLQSCLQLRS